MVQCGDNKSTIDSNCTSGCCCCICIPQHCDAYHLNAFLHVSSNSPMTIFFTAFEYLQNVDPTQSIISNPRIFQNVLVVIEENLIATKPSNPYKLDVVSKLRRIGVVPSSI